MRDGEGDEERGEEINKNGKYIKVTKIIVLLYSVSFDEAEVVR